MKQKKPVGRPPKAQEDRRRKNLTIRVRDAVKASLDVAAAANQRSLSEEAEFRLERTFHEQQLLPELLELAYGRSLAGLLLVLGKLMREVGGEAAFVSTRTMAGVKSWADDPWAYEQVMNAVTATMEALRPEGDVQLPSGVPAAQEDEFRELGRQFAATAVEMLVSPGRGVDQEWARAAREKLGTVADRLPGKVVADTQVRRGASK